MREITWNTEQTVRIYDETNTWLFHLENNPAFFNSFVPRGLFWDLMDNSGIAEDFDNISGHDIEDIYELLEDDVWTIQDFREVWEDEYQFFYSGYE